MYVGRDAEGKIWIVATGLMEGFAEEYLAVDDPELVQYLHDHPIPPPNGRM